MASEIRKYKEVRRKRKNTESSFKNKLVKDLRLLDNIVKCNRVESRIGSGIPDILICTRSRNILIEVKLGGNKPTELQKSWLTVNDGMILLTYKVDKELYVVDIEVDESAILHKEFNSYIELIDFFRESFK